MNDAIPLLCQSAALTDVTKGYDEVSVTDRVICNFSSELVCRIQKCMLIRDFFFIHGIVTILARIDWIMRQLTLLRLQRVEKIDQRLVASH